MSQNNPVDILNQLIALHSTSLPVYLESAEPWAAESDRPALAVLSQIATDQQLMAARLRKAVLDLNGRVATCEFPIDFSGMHDLSLSYLLRVVVDRHVQEIAFIEKAVSALADCPIGLAMAEEALGAARGHLDSLRELSLPA